MILSAFLQNLSYSELSNTAMGMNGVGSIREEDIPNIIGRTNMALLDIFTKFCLKENELILISKENVSLYPLRAEYAVNSSSGFPKYILDRPEKPFTGDVIKILAVFNEIGEELPFNDPEQEHSVFSPQFDILQLTETSYEKAYSVSYQARHPILKKPTETLNYGSQLIDLPIALETALRYKVSAGIFSAMSGQEYSNIAQALDAKYEVLCSELENRNMVGQPSISTDLKLKHRGFP